MLKKLYVFVLIALLVPIAIQAQNKVKKIVPKAPVVFDMPTINQTDNSGPGFSTASANYVAVDTMANAFGPGIAILNPLAYDPYSNVVAYFHRGSSTYGLGSGQLFYAYSTDQGVSWTTRVGPVNADPVNSRYPSMSISNPTQGDITATTGLFSWPELNPGAFGNVGFGVDQPVGGNATFSDTVVGVTPYSSQVPNWASATTPWMFWVADRLTAGDASLTLFRTEDFITVEIINPPQWASSVFQDNGNICLGGVSYNDVEYVGVIGSFADPDTANPIQFGWYPGVSKSTDNGTTWSDFEVVDFRTIPALSDYDQLFDYSANPAFVRFDGDINVDANGHFHFLVGATDTTDGTSNVDAIVDIFETGSGWDATVVTSGGFIETPYATGPGLGQMGYSCYLAFDETRTVMAAQWCKNSTTSDWTDLYFSYKPLNETVWSIPQNLTESDQQNNTQSHFAPMIASNGRGSNYTAFSMYGYVAGATGPYSDTTLATVIYVAPVDFVITGVDDGSTIVNSFELGQNYPNPFNPSTLIKYTIAERSNVVLKVYDVLGKEVATLVNSNQDVGSHEVNFNASDLSSGLYIYTIKAGNFTSSKKMMLLK